MRGNKRGYKVMKSSTLEKEIKISHNIKFYEYSVTKNLRKNLLMHNLLSIPYIKQALLKDYKKLEKELA